MNLTVLDCSISQDDRGLWRINDLHKAAGGEKRHSPMYWIATQQIATLLENVNDKSK